MLVGCRALGAGPGGYSPPVQAGARVVVHQRLRVPPGYARVYLQYGNPVSYAAMDQYAPQCNFVMREPLPFEQFVNPGEYDVVAVRQRDVEIVQSMPLRSASLARRLAWDAGHGPVATLVQMRLRGVVQPDLVYLACSSPFDVPALVLPPTLADINRALGDKAVLIPAPPPATD